jgi:hypothetical protein
MISVLMMIVIDDDLPRFIYVDFRFFEINMYVYLMMVIGDVHRK